MHQTVMVQWYFRLIEIQEEENQKVQPSRAQIQMLKFQGRLNLKQK